MNKNNEFHVSYAVIALRILQKENSIINRNNFIDTIEYLKKKYTNDEIIEIVNINRNNRKLVDKILEEIKVSLNKIAN